MLDRKHLIAAAMSGKSAERYLGELMTLASMGEVRIKFDNKAHECTVIVTGQVSDHECAEGEQVFTAVAKNGLGRVMGITLDPLTMCIIELRPLWVKECEEDPK